MKLLIVLITYNRLDYSKRTLHNLLQTVTVPHYIIAVDNASTDSTQQFLIRERNEKRIDAVVCNSRNYYPGRATNIGWAEGLKGYPEATHLMRLDNDMYLEPGWDVKAAEYFEKIFDLGQLGLDYEAVEGPEAKNHELLINGMIINPWPGNVGGPNIISRKVWDYGLRYDETPWQDYGTGRPTPQEDCKFSAEIQRAGFLFGHAGEELGRTFANQSNWHEFPEYYKKTMSERGYPEPKFKEEV